MPEQQDTKEWQEALRRIEEAKRSSASSLNLTGLALTAIPESVTQLSSLQVFDLRDNRLASIPNTLAQLSNLQWLNLGANRLTTIPSILAQLSNLQYLCLTGNQLSVIPDSLAQLSNLQTLDLCFNQLATVPNSLVQLGNLRYLYLASNRLTAIPDSLAQLSNLKILALSGNQLSVVPDSLVQLNNLEYLNLSGNQLISIPSSLAKLLNLIRLDLSDNRLTAVPESLAYLQELTALFLHGNPELGIPDEILGPTSSEVQQGKDPKSPRGIFSYLSKLRDARPLNEGKLIMVGQGGVGKTSLVKKLTTGKFRRGEKTTEGIKISDWTCQLGPKNQVIVHIWDFGGQEMMHATHQFFLTQRSLYLLVLNRRQGGTDREADYWFRLIRAFGGKDAPVLVVLNKQKSEPFDVNRGGWMEKYAVNIRGFVETDCADGKSIALLKRKIQDELQNMKSIKARFPRRWFAIKDELLHMGEQYITFEAYRAICRKHGEQDQENQTSLAGFLHDLGIALNYKDDPRLRFAYVLKPEWVTEGIYALLHSFVRSKGVFSRSEAEKVLKRKGYPSEAAGFILGLIEQFELCFPLGDSHRRLLIPQLLDDQQPEEVLGFKTPECLNFGYEYTVVPDGLLPRFIVRTQHLSELGKRWRSGVILHDQSSSCRALVRADSMEGQIRIHIDGPLASRRDLLRIIRYNFDVIHSDYEFKPINLVYPPGAPEQPLPLDQLEALARNGTTSMPVVLRDWTVINAKITDLMEPIKSFPRPLKLFLAYADKDERYITEIRKDLKLMERNGLIRAWCDGGLTIGEKYGARMLEELNEADVVVCQLSPEFLRSKFWVLIELDKAIQRKAAGQAALVAYVLKDCKWTDVGKLANFQILPLDTQPLISWPDQDGYWRAVAEGIRETLRAFQRNVHSGDGHETVDVAITISTEAPRVRDNRLPEPDLPTPNATQESQTASCPIRLFLSYAHQDKKYFAELEKDLKLMKQNGLISMWSDHALTAGEKWEERILQELTEADVIVCQLSRDFLSSDFCFLIELDTAIKRKLAGKAELIAYVLRDCGWNEVPKLKQFQILPRGARPLCDWKEKNKYWRAVAEGIQEVVRRMREERSARPLTYQSVKVSSRAAGQ